MSWLGRGFQALRAWAGLTDAAESRLTPDHGWLLATPADARQRRADAGERGLRAPRAEGAPGELGATPGPPAPVRLLGRP